MTLMITARNSNIAVIFNIRHHDIKASSLVSCAVGILFTVCCLTINSVFIYPVRDFIQWRNDGVAAASRDGGPTLND